MNSNIRWLIVVVGIVMLAAIGALLYFQMSNQTVTTLAQDELHQAIVIAREAQLKEIVGIGVALNKTGGDQGALQIAKVLPSSPAEEAGLGSGLVVLKIDGMLTEGMNLQESADRLRGSVGTKVKLELLDPKTKTTNSLEINRRKVKD